MVTVTRRRVTVTVRVRIMVRVVKKTLVLHVYMVMLAEHLIHVLHIILSQKTYTILI